jgi:flavocytochrome c
MSETDRPLSADIVIVGGGLAGAAAALEAANSGADVLLLEKMADTGGSSAMSGGCLAFAGTDLQRAHKVEDSSALLKKDLIEVGQGENVPELVDAYVDNQLETYEWLKAAGAEFSPVVEASSGQSVPRAHTVDPADLVRLLLSHAKATARVRVLTSAPVNRLVTDETGRVSGVTAQLGDELVRCEARKAVILCSGGFSRDKDLMRRFVTGYDNALITGGEGNFGDGLRMGWSLGADLRDMPFIKGTFGKHPTDDTNVHSCQAVYKGAIAVNQDGKRFVNESISYKLLGDACLRQPYGAAFQILDQKIFEQGDNRVRILDFERRLEDGLMLKAETLDELAALIDVPADVLKSTVEEYNGFVESGEDKAFGRKHLVHNHGELARIDEAPFYTYPSTTVIFGTYCGLAVDRQMRVCNVYKEPIAGLLAAGEVVGGLHGAAYMTGSALGKAVIFGRLAARTAVAQSARAN